MLVFTDFSFHKPNLILINCVFFFFLFFLGKSQVIRNWRIRIQLRDLWNPKIQKYECEKFFEIRRNRILQKHLRNLTISISVFLILVSYSHLVYCVVPFSKNNSDWDKSLSKRLSANFGTDIWLAFLWVFL